VQLLQPGGSKDAALVASWLSVTASRFGDPPRMCDKCLNLCLEILAETSPA
jgi:hypothetical protein